MSLRVRHLALALALAVSAVAQAAAGAKSARPVGRPPARARRAPEGRVRAVVELVRTFGRWIPCGGVHDVGAVEVRVVRGESGVLPERDLFPGRHVVVWLSCPADFFPTRTPGARLRITLTARRPPWPHNLAIERRLPRDLPQLYARAVTLLWAPPRPAHRQRRRR